ncbi:MAG: hypothetical protein Q8L75_14775 [Acidobacteriota bacterium]|nr:hypothetical protein [Acidobacteriota bacterium]
MPRQEIRSYDYVNHPYAKVREALVADPGEIFRAATRTAAVRARSVAAELRVTIAGVDVAAEVIVSIGTITDEAGPQGGPLTRIPVSWEAAKHPQLFPLMSAELTVYPLTATETQLDFLGRYDPPLGVVGGAMDALAGHRVAEASVHRLISDVARHLRDRLAQG